MSSPEQTRSVYTPRSGRKLNLSSTVFQLQSIDISSALASAFAISKYFSVTNSLCQSATSLMARPKFNTSGKAVQININSHKILEYPNKTVYQYDVCGFAPFSRIPAGSCMEFCFADTGSILGRYR